MALTALDYAEIQQLYARYSQAVDLGTPEDFAAVFTADATFITAIGEYVGRDRHLEFARWFRENLGESIRHWTNNLVLQETADGVKGTCYFAAGSVGPSGLQPTSSGVYYDLFVKGPEGWRIASRDVRPDAPVG